MPLHDASYQHWTGAHLGIWRRRAAIAQNGLKGCLANRWMRHLIVLCWVGAAAQTVVLFAVGQLLVADSLIVQWTANLNPALQAFARLLTGWLERHPEISVRTTQNILFYFASGCLLPLSLVGIAQAIPHLITRDLSSQAIIVYASKAVGRWDYLLGKFAAVFGLLVLTWLGPLVAAWFIGNLLAPDWHFFWHSRLALANTLIYVLGSMCVLSGLALGVSAISSKEKTAVAMWVAWWIVDYVLVGIARETKPWLKHLSFKHNLDELALAVFRLHDDVKLAQENIPVLGDLLRKVKPATLDALQHPATTASVLALSIMLGLAVLILVRRLKPE
jgi:ABC-type transport system involved in multi-copper enzyme maturation permease subunit